MVEQDPSPRLLAAPSRAPASAVALALVAGAVVLGLGAGAALALDVSPTHEHTAHDHQISAVEYDDEHGIVWSIGQDPEAESVVLAGYDVEQAEVVVTEEFDNGHALAVGDGVVYVADQHTLWEFDVASEESTELARMDVVAGAMAFDNSRDLVWIAGGGEGHVVARDAETGDVVTRHDAHVPNGLADISVRGDYVATVATWEPEAVVYDVESEEVAFEPLPDSIAEADDGNLVSVHLTDSGELILGGGWDSVFMYDLESREIRAQYAAHSWGVSAVDYHESEDVIVSAGMGNSLAFFDVGADTVVGTHGHDDTIYAADLDATNDVVWFGDGEERPGRITGLELTFEEAGGTVTETDESAADGEAADGDGEVTAGEDGPGFGLVAAVLALLGVALVGSRRHV